MLYTTWFVCAKELLAEGERAVSATVARTPTQTLYIRRPSIYTDSYPAITN